METDDDNPPGIYAHTYRSAKSFGERYEYIAISELLKRGFDVYKNLVDDQALGEILGYRVIIRQAQYF